MVCCQGGHVRVDADLLEINDECPINETDTSMPKYITLSASVLATYISTYVSHKRPWRPDRESNGRSHVDYPARSCGSKFTQNIIILCKMPRRIQDRIALVTGSSSGLGRALALKFASEGAKVCCVDLYSSPRNRTNAATGKADDFNHRIEGESTPDELRRLYGKDAAIFVQADVTKPVDVQNAVAQCVERYGRLDIMANNAGISVESTHPRPLGVHETSEEDWVSSLVNAMAFA